MEKQRNEKGQWMNTTDVTLYKRVQFNGIKMSAQNREFCMALNIPFIPKGFAVHHLDRNPRNNNIDNLALVTVTAHNRIHAHSPWNKGLKASTDTKWGETIKKIQGKRNQTFISRWEEAYNLRLEGKTYEEIGKILGKSRMSVSNQVKKYKESLEKI